MNWQLLYIRASNLALQCNHYLIMHDLPMMTESELLGLIGFLIRLQER